MGSSFLIYDNQLCFELYFKLQCCSGMLGNAAYHKYMCYLLMIWIIG